MPEAEPIPPEEAAAIGAAPDKPLTPEARRALEEAAARRRGDPDAPGATPREPAERGGPAGPEPTRFGDWELKGRAIDFS